MDLFGAAPGSPRARLDVELGRTVDRVRGLALTRLDAAFEPEATRAEAVRLVAQRLADLAADAEGRPRRLLAPVAPSAVGDQLAVCGHDLLADEAAACLADADLDAAADALLALRRRL